MTNEFTEKLRRCEWQRHVEFHTVMGEHASHTDTCEFCQNLVPAIPQFDRINHGPFEHPVSE